MIEIKITIDSALAILLERMNMELKIRQRDLIIPKGLKLENLPHRQLMPIVEASIFDTVFLLPPELVIRETNLINIITGTVRALSRIVSQDEFRSFSSQRTSRIIQPIVNHLQIQIENKNFQFN